MHGHIVVDGAEYGGLLRNQAVFQVVIVGAQAEAGGHGVARQPAELAGVGLAAPCGQAAPAILPGTEGAAGLSKAVQIYNAVHLTRDSQAGGVRIGGPQPFDQGECPVQNLPGVLNPLPWLGGRQKGVVGDGAGGQHLGTIHNHAADGGGSDIKSDGDHRAKLLSKARWSPGPAA